MPNLTPTQIRQEINRLRRMITAFQDQCPHQNVTPIELPGGRNMYMCSHCDRYLTLSELNKGL